MPRLRAQTELARQSEILEAAEACFVRKGFAATTILDVIEESGLSAGCIYSHFVSKAQLVEALSASRHRRDSRLLGERGGSSEGLADVRRMARAFLDDARSPDGLRARHIGVQLWSLALFDPAVRAQVLEGIHVPLAAIGAVLAAAQEQGQIAAELDTSALARALVALLQGTLLQCVWGEAVDVDAVLAVFDAFLAGLAPAPLHAGVPARPRAVNPKKRKSP